MNTIFNFLYRDAANYKIYNTCIVRGQLSEEQIRTILDSLDMGQYFIPEQVGLPVIRFEPITDDDYCWCEIVEGFYEFVETHENVELSVEELTANFAAAKGNWDEVKYALKKPTEEEIENSKAYLQSYSENDMIAALIHKGIPAHRILEKFGFIAWKLWSREDIASKLEESGFAATEENIDEVLNSGCLSALGDCTDEDWEIISLAIEESAKRLRCMENEEIHVESKEKKAEGCHPE